MFSLWTSQLIGVVHFITLIKFIQDARKKENYYPSKHLCILVPAPFSALYASIFYSGADYALFWSNLPQICSNFGYNLAWKLERHFLSRIYILNVQLSVSDRSLDWRSATLFLKTYLRDAVCKALVKHATSNIYFTIKTLLLHQFLCYDINSNRLDDTIRMNGHNIGFGGKIKMTHNESMLYLCLVHCRIVGQVLFT